METLSALLALCEEKPPVTVGFPHKKPNDSVFWWLPLLAWTCYWANSHDAGDLRRRDAQVSSWWRHTCSRDCFKVIFSSLSWSNSLCSNSDSPVVNIGFLVPVLDSAVLFHIVPEWGSWLRWMICDITKAWWRHDMETLSTSLAPCEENPPVNGGFSSQWVSDADIWCFLWCYHKRGFGQITE